MSGGLNPLSSCWGSHPLLVDLAWMGTSVAQQVQGQRGTFLTAYLTTLRFTAPSFELLIHIIHGFSVPIHKRQILKCVILQGNFLFIYFLKN